VSSHILLVMHQHFFRVVVVHCSSWVVAMLHEKAIVV
jgi:hypothetical protein